MYSFKQKNVRRKSKEDDAATQIQRVFRSFSTRLFLTNASIFFRGEGSREWNEGEKDIVSSKVESEFMTQQILIRQCCIDKYQQSIQLFEKSLRKVNNDTANNIISEDKDDNTQDIREHMENLIHFMKKFREKNHLIIRQVGTFFEQLQVRSESIQSVLHFISMHPYPEGEYCQYYANWIQSETKSLTTSLISCDIAQEAVIERETHRVLNDLNTLLSSNQMTGAVVNLLRNIRSLEAESCGLNDNKFPNLEVYENALIAIRTKLKIAREKELPRICHNLSEIIKNEVKICDMHFVDDAAKTSSFLIDGLSYPKVQTFEREEWMTMFNHRPWLLQRDTDEFNSQILRKGKADELNKRARKLQRTNEKLEFDRSQALIAKRKIQIYIEKSQNTSISMKYRNAYESAAKTLQSAIDEFEKSEQSRCEIINTETMQINKDMRSLQDDEAKTEQKSEIQPPSTSKDKDLDKEVFRREGRARATQQYVHDRVLNHYLNSQEVQEDLNFKDTFDWTSDQKVLNSVGIKDKARIMVIFRQIIKLLRKKILQFNINLNISLPKYTRQLKKNNDPELRMMMVTANKTMTNQSKSVSAVTSLKFTVGKTETDAFADCNDSNYSEGLPFYQNKLELGQHDQIVLWIKKDTDQNKFFSEVQLGSGRPNEMEFQTYSEKGFCVENHERLDGGIWFKRSSSSSRVVSNIKVSYCNSGNESIYEKDFDKIDINLTKYGLANAYLWIEKKGRDDMNAMVDIASMEKELEEYESMLSNAPSDYIIQGMVSELRRRLEVAKGQELQRRDLSNVDHLEYIVEFLALSDRDVACFKSLFRKLDSKKEGRVSIDRLLRYLGESITLSPLVNHLIEIALGGIQVKHGTINFSETTRALATIATFNNEELVKATFRSFDKSGYGVIKDSDFFKLLSWLHPNNRGATKRALREVDIPEMVTYYLFSEIHLRFPLLLFPIMKFQQNVRRKCISAKFWRKKRKKFQQAKELAMNSS